VECLARVLHMLASEVCCRSMKAHMASSISKRVIFPCILNHLGEGYTMRWCMVEDKRWCVVGVSHSSFLFFFSLLALGFMPCLVNFALISNLVFILLIIICNFFVFFLFFFSISSFNIELIRD